MKLVVGLGNPGKEYELTRHNAGFMALDTFVAEYGLEWKKEVRRHALLAQTTMNDETILLVKPQTFMNESGASVQGFISFFHIAPEDVLIVHDEMDLEAGRLAFIGKAGHAGHNGVRDIQERLGTNEIARLRLGVGRPVGPIEKEDWVLMRPEGEDRTKIAETIQSAVPAIETWINGSLVKAMNEWN
ncbi:MAG: aminoacyl-tRNA hydrolase [Patescibacteria group bacterium]|jgi:PTH1 family peptidyl-tRNA hydrolase